jgi:hypothetical protein
VKLFLRGDLLGELAIPARLFGSKIIYVCNCCGVAWGRMYSEHAVGDWFPSAATCSECKAARTPRHVPGSFYQYYVDFSPEHREYWLEALPACLPVLKWECERHLALS